MKTTFSADCFSQRPTRILLLDSCRVVLEGLKALLADRVGLRVVGEATDGCDGLRKVPLLSPQIIVTECRLPLVNGLLVACQAKNMDPTIKIIMYTEDAYRYYLPDILRSPISAHVIKNRIEEDLLKAIEIVKDGGSFFTEDVVHLWSEVLSNGGDRLDPFEQLTLREKEVFHLIAEGHSVREAAGYLCVSPKTVETHKYNILEKLGMKSTAQLTKMAIQINSK